VREPNWVAFWLKSAMICASEARARSAHDVRDECLLRHLDRGALALFLTLEILDVRGDRRQFDPVRVVLVGRDSLVFSRRESRLVSASIMAWVWVMLAACAATGVTINEATLKASTTRGVDRVVPRRRTRIIKTA